MPNMLSYGYKVTDNAYLMLPIFEVLKDKEALVMVRKGDKFLVAENHKGNIKLRWVSEQPGHA